MRVENYNPIFADEGNPFPSNKRGGGKKTILIVGISLLIFAIIAIVVGNIYATANGYDNVIAMIKEWVMPKEEVIEEVKPEKNETIFTDREIMLSYEPITITENIKMIIQTLKIQANKAKMFLQVKVENPNDTSEFPIKYRILDEQGEILAEKVSNAQLMVGQFSDEIEIDNFPKGTQKTTLEIYIRGTEKVKDIVYDLKSKGPEISGQTEYMKQISESALKDILEGTDITQGATCIDISSISCNSENREYTVKFTYSHLGEGLFDLDYENLVIYETEAIVKLSNNNLQLVSINNPNIITKSKEQKELERAQEAIENYLDVCDYREGAYYLLAQLGLETEANLEQLIINSGITDKNAYIQSNVPYEEFKAEMLKYVSENLFAQGYSTYTDMNGYVGVTPTAYGTQVADIEKLELKKQQNGKYYYTVTLKDVELYEHFINPEEGENIREEECFYKVNVVLVEQNGKLVVDKAE